MPALFAPIMSKGLLDTNQTTLAAWPFSSPGPVLMAVGNTDGIEGHRKIIVKGERLKSDFA
jgi:hypothetical protein